jgi:hypothetical protein
MDFKTEFTRLPVQKDANLKKSMFMSHGCKQLKSTSLARTEIASIPGTL